PASIPTSQPRALRVDLVVPATLRLGAEPLAELRRAAELLHAIQPDEDPIRRFRDAFVVRYGDDELPLAEALDEERGIGPAGRPTVGTVAATPLAAALRLSGSREAETRFGARDALLLRKCEAAWRSGARSLTLEDQDLAELRIAEPL